MRRERRSRLCYRLAELNESLQKRPGESIWLKFRTGKHDPSENLIYYNPFRAIYVT